MFPCIGLSKQEGAEMTATFWGSFAAARGLAIPAAILLSPEVIMWTSLATAFGRGLLSLQCVVVEP